MREEVRGVSLLTFERRRRHLSELLAVGEDHGEAEFLVEGERRVTYREAFERSRRLAFGLQRRFGIEPGDRIGILGANAIDWVVSHWAGIALDALVVPLNAWWTAEELAFGLRDSGVDVLCADPRRAHTALAAGMPPEAVVVWGDAPPWASSLDRIASGDPCALPGDDRRDEDDPALLFYTSGTTGRPKGALLTHRNVIANVMNTAAMVRAAGAASGSERDGSHQTTSLCVIPLFHATANLAIMAPYVAAGNRLAFMPPGRFDPEVAADLIEQERVTHIGGVPTVLHRILDSGVWRRRDFSCVRSVTYGGAPASAALVSRIVEAFPQAKQRLGQGYGLTETASITSLNLGADYLERPGSVGIAAPTVELRVAGPDDAPLPAGETGEIQVRGSNVFAGYWKRTDDTLAAFTPDGYFRTGDIGHLDTDGFLYVTDRAKDVVIRGGENVYSVEVERVLEAHPAVAEAAVIGVPHPDLGEEVAAVVVLHDHIGTDQIAEFIAGHLAPFKVPTRWVVRDDPLPRNPAGKILKAALRQAGGPESAVDDDTDSAL